MRSKRKQVSSSDENHQEEEEPAVVVSVMGGSDAKQNPAEGGDNDTWASETRQILHDMKLRAWQESNDTMTTLSHCLHLASNFSTRQVMMKKESSSIQKNLLQRIEKERETCMKESDDLYAMELKLQQLQVDQDALKESLQDMESLEHEMKERIVQYDLEASEQVESIDQVEAERKRQVPRLKQQISLYATTTGIKWDYDQEHLLVGEVAVPSIGGMRKFSIDPRECNEFMIANQLWSFMEGDPSPAAVC
mmetsp:Transcript_14110/g.22040  ORF Transcript_14110/g.22040 Transcript_14110/m.22040 type:complete len:250 (-) Transcript_14110:154-903(-)|eukprot:CAMPEP_0195297174 /NCGR_PEP_ID=MMETSP0707-20130614/20964_1 /TAXON_ID=33640 /ORGANISM="Asterionellopsis glacialis, Strain CCMP134" /LENGTH=249 /DNA_ID=CAMNT_0040358901 /DNA_START=118 /DNA_END=867 /DNA_ORIENTATION=-